LIYFKARICGLAHIKVMHDEMLTRLLSALADPTRRRALALLWQGRELCVCELMERLGVTQSRMSRHMIMLKAVGLVVDRRDAQWVRYRRSARLPADVERVISAVMGATPTPSKGRSGAAQSASRTEVLR
jgi:ArsR family transcriptional regulator